MGVIWGDQFGLRFERLNLPTTIPHPNSETPDGHLGVIGNFWPHFCTQPMLQLHKKSPMRQRHKVIPSWFVFSVMLNCLVVEQQQGIWLEYKRLRIRIWNRINSSYIFFKLDNAQQRKSCTGPGVRLEDIWDTLHRRRTKYHSSCQVWCNSWLRSRLSLLWAICSIQVCFGYFHWSSEASGKRKIPVNYKGDFVLLHPLCIFWKKSYFLFSILHLIGRKLVKNSVKKEINNIFHPTIIQMLS